MNWATAIVLIVLIAAIAGVMRNRQRGSRRQEMSGEALHSAREEALQQEVEELRERIKVLERIATDGNTQGAAETRRIAEEIEALRGESEH